VTRPSLWIDGRRPATAALAERLSVDVAVIGAGITGLTAAVQLARAGCRVAVLENRRLASGATGFTTAKISLLQGARYRQLQRDHGPAVTEGYAAANTDAADWIRQRVRSDGVNCGHEHRTALTWAHDRTSMAQLEEEVEAAQAAGVDARLVTETDLPFPVAGGVQLADQAQFDPVAYLNGLAGLAEAAGAMLHEHTRVKAVQTASRSGPLRVLTDTLEVSADHVLVCTGVPFMDRGLFFARMEPVRSYLIAVPAPRGAPRSMSISVDEPVRSLRTTPGADGEELLLVGGSSHTVGRRADTEGAYQALEDWTAEVLGVAEVRATWSTQDYVPLRRLDLVVARSGPGRHRVRQVGHDERHGRRLPVGRRCPGPASRLGRGLRRRSPRSRPQAGPADQAQRRGRRAARQGPVRPAWTTARAGRRSGRGGAGGAPPHGRLPLGGRDLCRERHLSPPGRSPQLEPGGAQLGLSPPRLPLRRPRRSPARPGRG